MTIEIKKTSDTALLAILNHDVQELHHEIEADLFKPHSNDSMKEFFDELLINKNVSAYIAYYNEKAAAYMLLSKIEREENHYRKAYSYVNIEQICVEKDFKGKGVGKALVDFAKDYARELNITRLEMNYWVKNINSGEFFRSQGFETYNERLAIKI